MAELPVIKDRELVSFLESIGFELVRIRGFHPYMRAKDGSLTTINKRFLRKIIREDLEMTLEDFLYPFAATQDLDTLIERSKIINRKN